MKGCRKMIKGGERGRTVGCWTYYHSGGKPANWHVIDNVVYCNKCFKEWKKDQRNEKGNIPV